MKLIFSSVAQIKLNKASDKHPALTRGYTIAFNAKNFFINDSQDKYAHKMQLSLVCTVEDFRHHRAATQEVIVFTATALTCKLFVTSKQEEAGLIGVCVGVWILKLVHADEPMQLQHGEYFLVQRRRIWDGVWWQRASALIGCIYSWLNTFDVCWCGRLLKWPPIQFHI